MAILLSGQTWTSLLNYALFQAGWFVCVLGAAAGYPWLAAAAGLLLVLVHLALVRNAAHESLLLLASLLLGLLVDGVHIRTGVLVFPIGSFHPSLPPAWILVLWLQFAMSLHYSLGWLNGRYFLGALLGSVSGALAYWAGVRFGAAQFSDDNIFRCLLQIGASWGLVMVILLWVAARTSVRDSTILYRLKFLTKSS
ncbi:DUF2878 domain-containing protein [uncultured Desulfobulbus sp.]|uniref:DUF2878 domain-containing protein n=1 Tax=uncultured Desulfobulbus sp. TaxID=239745 RepID=UPI0029C975DE|nr:DUF2878 domain-containing protein [uncultured Desulfobulbus sp.]